MAILRGGRRIGNYDIRVGIPRDRSLDNVNADERLRRKPGGNPAVSYTHLTLPTTHCV